MSAGASGGKHAKRLNEAMEESRRHSTRSHLSAASNEDAEWELVSKLYLADPREDVSAGGGSGVVPVGQAAYAYGMVNSAGDWLQWGLEGALRGVEQTYDGLTALMHYKRLTKERKDALELASRQQWQLMEVEQERRRERERIEAEEHRRTAELEEELRKIEQLKKDKERAEANLKSQLAALSQASQSANAMQEEVERLRRDAEQRGEQEAAAVAQLKQLQERQSRQQSEDGYRVRELAEREDKLKQQHEQQALEINALREQLQRLEQEARAAQSKNKTSHSGEGAAGSGEQERGNGSGDVDEGAERPAHSESPGHGNGIQVADEMALRRVSQEMDLPDEFFCSITMELMQDPVIAADGFSYERSAIQDWLDKGHRTSPKTGANLTNTLLLPNLSLKSLIQDVLLASTRNRSRAIGRQLALGEAQRRLW